VRSNQNPYYNIFGDERITTSILVDGIPGGEDQIVSDNWFFGLPEIDAFVWFDGLDDVECNSTADVRIDASLSQSLDAVALSASVVGAALIELQQILDPVSLSAALIYLAFAQVQAVLDAINISASTIVWNPKTFQTPTTYELILDDETEATSVEISCDGEITIEKILYDPGNGQYLPLCQAVEYNGITVALPINLAQGKHSLSFVGATFKDFGLAIEGKNFEQVADFALSNVVIIPTIDRLEA